MPGTDQVALSRLRLEGRVFQEAIRRQGILRRSLPTLRPRQRWVSGARGMGHHAQGKFPVSYGRLIAFYGRTPNTRLVVQRMRCYVMLCYVM